MSNPLGRRGLSAVEVVVVILVLGILVLTLMMVLPRRLETSRRVTCQRNLMQIGMALALYDQETGHLPTIFGLEVTHDSRRNSPLSALLDTLALPDFRTLTDLKTPRKTQPGAIPKEQPVPGFICPSDRNATAGFFPAPISYRATTGDSPDASNGAFSPGKVLRLADIEAGDGLAYTAAYSERLVGNNRAVSAPENYGRVPGPLKPGGCPPIPASNWLGDAGRSWVSADWRSTLYNHALTPNASPSCVAEDGRSAYIGASSGHPDGVNVLYFDGSVKVYTPRVDPKIWRDLATPNAPATAQGAPR